MLEKLSFTERAERVAEAAASLRRIGQDLAWIADVISAEAEAMAVARERFASQCGRGPVRAAK